MNKKRDNKKLSEKIREQHDYLEEERHPLDKYEDQKFVDDIPLKDLEIEVEQERKKHKTQDNSQSESKYRTERK